MTFAAHLPPIRPTRLFRSAASVYAGFLVILGLTLALKALPIAEASAANLAWRSLFMVAGCYIAARFSPAAPMRHALALGFKGVMLGIIEGAAGLGGPLWPPILLIAAAMPCALVGGALVRAR